MRWPKRLTDLRATKPEEPFIRALTEQPGKVPTTHVFFRGNHDQPKAAVKPADLSVVALNKNPIPENDTQATLHRPPHWPWPSA